MSEQPTERQQRLMAGLARALGAFLLALETECGPEWKPAIPSAVIINVETGETLQFGYGIRPKEEVNDVPLN